MIRAVLTLACLFGVLVQLNKSNTKNENAPYIANFIHQLIVYILSLKYGDYESVKKELIRIKSPIKSSIMSIAEQLIEKGINQGIEKGISSNYQRQQQKSNLKN